MKYLYFLLLLAFEPSLEGMQTFSCFSRVGLQFKNFRLTPPVRSLQTLEDMKGVSRLGPYSLALGAHIFHTDLPKVYPLPEHSLGGLIKLFFHQNPADKKITITKYNKQMIQALPPTVVAQLLQAHETNYQQLDTDALTATWHDRYVSFSTSIDSPIKDKRNFRKKARVFLTTLIEQAKQLPACQTSPLLLSLAFKTMQNRTDVQDFAKAFSIDLPEEKYSDDEFYALETYFQNTAVFEEDVCPELIEKLIFWLLKKQRGASLEVDTSLLQVPVIDLPYKDHASRPLCAEETLRTLINILLYNFQTSTFDSSVLPEAIQKQCNPAFLAFIKKYHSPKTPDYYKKSAPQWLSLVAEVPGIGYKSKIFEILADPHNNLALLCHLFGQTDVTSYEALAERLSTQDRTVIFLQDGRNIHTEVKEKQHTSHEILTLKACVHFPVGHAYIEFKENCTLSPRALQTLEIVSSSLQKDLLSLRPYNLVDLKTISLQEFEKILTHQEALENEAFLKRVIATSRTDLLQALLATQVRISDNLIFYLIEKEEACLLPLFLERRQAPSLNPGFIFCALKKKNLALLQLLIDKGSNLEVKDATEQTPLLCAVSAYCSHQYGYLDCINKLLDAGCNLHACDKNGNTALHMAKRESYLLEKLLAAGADPTQPNNDGMTPLHVTARHGTAVCVVALIATRKCNLSLTDTYGKIAFDYVKSNKAKTEAFLRAVQKLQ